MKSKLIATTFCILALFATASYADTVYVNGVLNTSSPITHIPGTSTAGTGMQYYNVFQFTVDATGSYIFELASVNSAGTPSNALDTYFALYTGSFNPAAPGAATSTNDDFTGTRTVLPGPYAANGVTAASTGFSGANPGSRATVSLTAGVQYFLIVTSFRDTSFVSTTTSAQATGAYYVGVTGPGNISGIPEPATTALLGLAAASALGLRIWRKRRSA